MAGEGRQGQTGMDVSRLLAGQAPVSWTLQLLSPSIPQCAAWQSCSKLGIYLRQVNWGRKELEIWIGVPGHRLFEAGRSILADE